MTPARLAGAWEVKCSHTAPSSRVAGGRVEDITRVFPLPVGRIPITSTLFKRAFVLKVWKAEREKGS